MWYAWTRISELYFNDVRCEIEYFKFPLIKTCGQN
jgi:hypothetical protein